MGSYRQPGPRRRLRPGLIVAVLLALIIGLGGGYLLRYTTSGGSNSSAAAASSTASAPTTTPSPTGPPCASAADVGAQIVAQVRAAASAIGNLDPSGLEKVLDQIQRLQAQLEQALSACLHEATTSAPIPTTASPPTR